MTLEQKIASYRMSQQTLQLVGDAQLLLIAGIVSAGKDTTVGELLKSDQYYNIISHTTRQPRANHGVMEQDGRDYYFISLDQAESMVDDQSFVEVKYVHGNVYGTSASALNEANKQRKIAVTDIDIEGVTEYLNVKPETHAIFLLPPSVDTWHQRLTRRYGDLSGHSKEIDIRFETAKAELIKASSDERFILVVNDDLGTTVRRIQSIVSGADDKTSDYAYAVTEHLLDYLDSRG